MTITLTLSKILDKCNDWEEFCEDTGFSIYSVNEGGGHLQVSLSREQAEKYGLI